MRGKVNHQEIKQAYARHGRVLLVVNEHDSELIFEADRNVLFRHEIGVGIKAFDEQLATRFHVCLKDAAMLRQRLGVSYIGEDRLARRVDRCQREISEGLIREMDLCLRFWLSEHAGLVFDEVGVIGSGAWCDWLASEVGELLNIECGVVEHVGCEMRLAS
ncbi:hypothetical protein KS4_32820 [Poriferisphaera corsica]|uniref:Uncharacterized protein n=1 Tax=Poriferisphaera corsica TaxID=2528020 RepID=A0A517YY96_9BACT|nr:hypothetical protein [Poriferisphaera corsica]QDU35202.1 hypothetical protein KS4_32820 [Poriferisphaera corsica]